jgi:hypothetical protein
MKKNATFRHWFNVRPYVAPVAVLAVAALFLTVFGGAASAAPIGKDGMIHACYRVKGKPKGSLRVVRNARVHCRRGERKVAWTLAPAGANGQSGQGGQSGTAGHQGDSGAAGAPGSNEAALEAKVASLTLKVESLEGLLNGVGSGDLNGLTSKVNGLEGLLSGVETGDLASAVNTLEGVTKGELKDTIDALPLQEGLLEEVCGQTEELTGRSNALLGFINSLDTLNLLNLPVDLPDFENVCPAP